MSAESSAPIRLCARGPSGTLTASTPAALSWRTCSNIGAGIDALGRHDLDRRDEPALRQLGAEPGAVGERHRLDRHGRAPAPAACPCRTRAGATRSGRSPRSRGCGRASCRSSRRRTGRRPRPCAGRSSPCTRARPCRSCGRPPRAGGRRWAGRRSARVTTRASFSTASSTPCGPTEQLTPMTSAPIAASSGPKTTGSVP